MADDAVYYDPYNWEIDNDPYPTFKRLRDEAPLYRNDEHGFWAVSRFADVEKGLLDWRTYRSGRGSVLEMIKMGVEIPPGSILFEDPPTHDIHRALLARVFTPKRMNALEADVRGFCADVLDEKRDAPGFDFVSDLGNYVPMRAIGMLMGVPEEDQQRLRDKFDEGFVMESEDDLPEAGYDGISVLMGELTGYLDWRVDHPSDDLMTELLNAEVEELDGSKRRLSREEVLGYVGLLIGAGNETTTRLIGFTGRVLGENPDALREVSADHSLIPQAIEETLRLEAPSPVQARYVNEDVEWYGQKIDEGEIMLFINGAANRDERKFEDPDAFNIHRKADRHLTFGYGIHHCLGAALARLEGRIALEEVLKRFPFWEVDWDNVVQAHTTTVRGYHHMPVLTTKA
jgi:cytochrome P450